MNKVLLGLVSFTVVLAAPIATSNQSLAQSTTPISTETIEKWNTELRDQIRRLEAEKEGVELRQRARRLQAEKENAELHERVRRLQSELSTAQSPAPQQPSPQPERAAAQSSPQPQRAPPAERKPSRPNETELSSAQSPAPQQPQRAAPVSSRQPQRAAAESSPQPQRAAAAPAQRKPSRSNETEARREGPRQAAVEQQSPASNALFPWYPSWSSQPAAPVAAVPAAAAPAAAVPAAAVPAAAVPAASNAVVVHGTIDLNSSPEGALAQTSLGAGCETPCAMEVSTDRPFSVTFKQRGYAPSTVNIQIQRAQPGVTDPKFSPNPVFVQLTPGRTP